MKRLVKRRMVAIALLWIAIIGCGYVYFKPFNDYRRSSREGDFELAIGRLPAHARRKLIERLLGPPNSSLTPELMHTYLSQFVKDYQPTDVAVAYRTIDGLDNGEAGDPKTTCVLQYRNDQLVGRSRFCWTDHFILVGPSI